MQICKNSLVRNFFKELELYFNKSVRCDVKIFKEIKFLVKLYSLNNELAMLFLSSRLLFPQTLILGIYSKVN